MRLTFLLLIFFHAVSALAWTPVIRFNHLTFADGLSQSTVLSILQDNKGFLWFSTTDGLNRYDGYEFKVYRHDPHNRETISDSYVRVIYQDTKGALWAGTQGGGLNRYNHQTQHFEHFEYDEVNPHSLSNNVVWSVFEDSHGTLWVGTDNGLNRFNPETRDFTRFEHQPDNPTSLSHPQVRALYQDTSGSFWIGTNGGGLNRYNPKNEDFEHLKHDKSNPSSLSDDQVNSIYQDSRGTLWIGTANGLNQYDAKPNPEQPSEPVHFKRFNHHPADPHSLSHDLVKIITEDSAGILWIGTQSGGLNRFDTIRQRFDVFKHQPSTPNSLSHNSILSIFEDNNGILWVGTSGGLDRYNSQTRRFKHFNFQQDNPHSLSHNIVKALFEDNQGTLWVGTDGGGLNRYHRDTNQFTHFRHRENAPYSLSHDSVRVIYQDSKDTLMIGTVGGGISLYNPQTQHFTHWRHQPDNPNSLSHDNVRSILEDSQGTLWIGTDNGLNRYNAHQNTFTHLKYKPSAPHSLSNNEIRAVFEDSNGTLWVGTFGGGLNQYDAEGKRFVHFRHKTASPHSLSHDKVTSILEDSKGTLWIGTYGGGLNKYDAQTGHFNHYREKDGLPNDVVYGIVEDESGELWLSTNQGISRFNPTQETFRNYDVNDGLQSNEFNSSAYFQSTKGELFFGGINGFNRFFPNDIKDDKQIPPIVLTHLLLANQPAPIRSATHSSDLTPDGETVFTLPKAIDELEQLTLTYHQNLVSFEFAALNFTNPMKNQYAYKLEGQDKDWIYTDAKNRRATYTNMPSGRYTLRIKASNKDGYWNEQGKSLRITILPPPWKTWWAWCIYVFVLTALMLLVVYVLVERKRGLERSNQKIISLIEVCSQINATLDLNELLEIAYHRMQDLMDIDIFYIGQCTPDHQHIVFSMAVENNKRFPVPQMSMDETNRPAVWCIKHQWPIIINDFARDFKKYFGTLPLPAPLSDEEAGSLMCCPLIAGEQVIGVLSVQSYQKNIYQHHQQSIIKTLASTLAIALDNANAYGQIEEKNHEIIATQQQLVQSEKMASLGILTAGVAHEINNPTNFVHVSAQNLEVDLSRCQQFIVDLAGDDADSEVLASFDKQFRPLHQHLATIKDGTERIKIIVQDLRSFSQLDAADKKTVDIAALLQSTVHLIQTKYLEIADFDTAFESSPELLCYPAQLNQVFMNLIVNACDAIRDKQQQQEKNATDKTRGKITIGCRLTADKVEISVKDNGCGMTEQTKNKLFEPFYTTKEVGEGTGLGLSISYGIVQQHQGELSVESELGVGSVIYLRLAKK